MACTGSSSLNGTCYTASECTNKGGTSAGSCANGFGVCCTFVLGCGGKISENCTYFQSPTSPSTGACSATICKCSSDICQLRLDFSTFVITGPNTYTLSSLYTGNGGAVVTEAGMTLSPGTQCMTDTFSVTGYGSSPPVICGTNTGYHMYVDANPACNTLLFQLTPTAVGTTLATRQWNIKISQISCFSAWLPPQGCTQYYTGISNYFNSYNYAGGVLLANQKQTICMRRERGYCKMCISPSSITGSTDFSVSGLTTIKGFNNVKCCAYGTKGITDTTAGYDCLIIPNAYKTAGTHINNQFCGRYLVTAASATTGGKTVCTIQIPFNVQFLTDAFTNIGPASTTGFKLIYYQTTC